jgi:hypothetical protein
VFNRRSLLTRFAIFGIAPAGFLSADVVRPARMITDFSTKDTGLTWQTVNDTVMGGLSRSRIEVSDRGIARFSGTLSLENNGGFASVRSAGNLPDLTGYEALVVRAKGDGRSYQFRVRTGTGWRVPDYRAGFTTRKGAWQEHYLPFADFVPGWRGRRLRGVPPIDSAKIQSLGILLGDKKPGGFELSIDWIKAGSKGISTG